LQPCARMYRNAGSRWSGTTVGTATSHGEKGKREPKMTPSRTSSNPTDPQRLAGKAGPG
jgi:hypothetical protein